MQKLLFFSFLSAICLFFSGPTVQAQRYGTGVGLRLGNNDISRTVGITAQQRLMPRLTVEGIIQSDFSTNTTAHALVRRHSPVISKRFNYYYGAGLSAGVEESFVRNPDTREIIQTYGNRTTGMDFLVGVEMTLLNVTVSVDYKPNINLAGREEFFRGQVGISARTVLVKSKEQDKKRRQKARAKRKKQRQSGKVQSNSQQSLPVHQRFLENFRKSRGGK